ncbi:UNVERIFIED_CONTAM: Cytochrome c oxidase subunit 4 isoform 2, mitochondrial [Gekko kuhli]
MHLNAATKSDVSAEAIACLKSLEALDEMFPPKLRTLEDERKATQVRRMLDMCIDPAQGLASKWDYGNSEWKK